MKTMTIDWKEYNLVPVDAQSEDKEDKYDNLRKLIGRNGDDLCIFGKKMLQSIESVDEISIQYDNIGRRKYNNKLNFQETTLWELNYGDVFVLYEDTENYSDVCIFIWKDDDWAFVSQHISKYDWIEVIENQCMYLEEDTKIIKVLRG